MPTTSVASAVSVPVPSSDTQRVRYGFFLLGLSLAGIWFVCCRHLSAEWSYNEQYNYGWFVPFFALYLFWLRWEDRPETRIADSGLGNEDARNRRLVALAIAIPLLFILFPLRLIEVANPDWRLLSWTHALVAVGLTLLLVWWMGGAPWLRHFAFPILFFLVAVPWLTGIEQPIIQGLMPTVASIATETLSLFGIPADVQGNLIHINGGVVGVNEACSGVRSLQTSLMIGLLFGELKRLTTAKRIFLVVAAIAIAFVANCGRAFFLVWIAATRGVPQVEHFHDAAGYAIVGLVFFGCLALTTLLARGPSQNSGPSGRKSEADGANPKSEIRNAKFLLPSFYFLLSTLAFLVLAELGVETWYRSHERNLVHSAQWNVHWPESAPQFREARIDERTKSLLHFDEGRGAVWLNGDNSFSLTNVGGASTSLLYFFRWLPGHNSALLANAHRPDVCLPASGWRQTGDFGVRNYRVSDQLTIPFRHFGFANEAAGKTRFADAFYCVWEDRVPKGTSAETTGMSSTPSAWSRSERMQAVADGRRHLGQQVMEYLLIQARPSSVGEAENAFAASIPKLIAPSSKTL